ncbi:MAG TPA: hypothetical protein VIJ18_17980 [Microbacteriaceae bacterium]
MAAALSLSSFFSMVDEHRRSGRSIKPVDQAGRSGSKATIATSAASAAPDSRR